MHDIALRYSFTLQHKISDFEEWSKIQLNEILMHLILKFRRNLKNFKNKIVKNSTKV
jgi:hypothetical protein